MVIWTRPALADVKHIHDFIAVDSKHYAKKVAQAIKDKTDVLANLPNMGKKVPEVSRSDVKELHIYSYRIMYEIANNNCYVLAVIHKRQDFSAEDLPSR